MHETESCCRGSYGGYRNLSLLLRPGLLIVAEILAVSRVEIFAEIFRLFNAIISFYFRERKRLISSGNEFLIFSGVANYMKYLTHYFLCAQGSDIHARLT